VKEGAIFGCVRRESANYFWVEKKLWVNKLLTRKYRHVVLVL